MLTCLHKVAAGETGKQRERLVGFCLFVCVCAKYQTHKDHLKLYRYFLLLIPQSRECMLGDDGGGCPSSFAMRKKGKIA